MLAQRIITAGVLLTLWLPAIFMPELHLFAPLSCVLVALALWEWARLAGLSQASAWLSGLSAACVGGGLIYGDSIPSLSFKTWLVVSIAWSLICWLLLYYNALGWLRLHRFLRMTVGILILSAAWLALLTSFAWGANTLLSIMAIVWSADIGAYFAGKRWGKHKLAPSISPGKTWEGVMGGGICVALMAITWLYAESHLSVQSPSIYSTVLDSFGLLGLILTLSTLVVLSVCGDLVESLIKRAAGVKDSSGLLPGHGGILDRIDALLPVMPVAVMVILACQRTQGN